MPSATLSANADVLFTRWQAAVDRTMTDAKAERLKQLEKWGHQRHDLPVWMSILAEEVGEAAQQVNNLQFDPGGPQTQRLRKERLRDELLQVAAVALAIVQFIDEGSA